MFMIMRNWFKNYGDKASLQAKKGIAISIEILLVIGIVGFLFVIILANLSDGNSRINVQSATSALTDMTKETQNLFKAQGDFAGVSPTVLLNNGIVPSDMDNTTAIGSQWNTVVAVAPNTETGANDTFSFTYPGVDSEACSSFVSKSEESFYKIAVAGVDVKDLTTSSPLNVVTLGTQCATATAVDIQFFAARY